MTPPGNPAWMDWADLCHFPFHTYNNY